jgi:hypothetical protein
MILRWLVFLKHSQLTHRFKTFFLFGNEKNVQGRTLLGKSLAANRRLEILELFAALSEKMNVLASSEERIRHLYHMRIF